MPQPPQLSGSASGSTHTPSQSVVALLLHTHSPSSQTWPTAQTLPHAPQCTGLELVSMHAVPQASRPPLQPHSPSSQNWVPPQAWLQPPQWVGVESVSTHADPQRVVPSGHGSPAATHSPSAQISSV